MLSVVVQYRPGTDWRTLATVGDECSARAVFGRTLARLCRPAAVRLVDDAGRIVLSDRRHSRPGRI